MSHVGPVHVRGSFAHVHCVRRANVPVYTCEYVVTSYVNRYDIRERDNGNALFAIGFNKKPRENTAQVDMILSIHTPALRVRAK
jgi:hypothetical protein